jgi:methylated-DNA-[protein]-cysteine S-methyltransferase
MKPMIVYTEIDNPIVNLAVAGDEQGIRRIHFLNGKEKKRWAPEPEWRRDDRARALRTAVRELEAYFAGELRQFSLPLAPVGTPFQLDVWNALRAIPYGETRSYGELAERIGRPSAVRAVGAANGANPLPIVVPCHRVIGSNGSLTGFGGGLPLKQALLALERVTRDGQRSLPHVDPTPARAAGAKKSR